MATNITPIWDTNFNTEPEDTESRKYGAQQIRNLKDRLRKRLQIDHEIVAADGLGGDGETDTGYHKKVTLLKSTNAAPEAGYTALAAEGTNLTYWPQGGSERIVVNTNEAQTISGKVFTSPDINAPDIDGGTIDGTTIAGSPISGSSGGFTTLSSSGAATLASIANTALTGGTLNSASIGATTPATGAFTSLAASALATLAGGLTTGTGSLKFKVGSAVSATQVNPTLAVTVAHGLTNDDGTVILGAMFNAAARDAAFTYVYTSGLAAIDGTNISFTITRAGPPGNAWITKYNYIIFYVA